MLTTAKRFIAPLAAIVGLTAVAFEAQANPAFARQMEMNCMGCHSQSVPMLNSFGRQFKLSGYTMTSGGKSMITGGDLGTSVPVAINAGVGFKAISTGTDQTGKRGTLAVPAGASIMVGGKIAENMGGNTLWNGEGLVHIQGTYSKPLGGGNLGVSLYGAKGHGPFIAVESHNTGLHKELAMFDSSQRSNAVQAIGMGLGKGPSSGLVAFYGGYGLKAAVGMQSQGFNSTYSNGGLDTDGSSGSLYRLTYDAPSLAGWNISVGAFGLSGTTTGTTSLLYENTNAPFAATPWAGNVNQHELNSNGFDLQVQGAVAGIDIQALVTVVGNYEFKIKNEAGTTTMINQDLATNSVEIQVMPLASLGFRVGQMDYKDNNTSTKDYKTTNLGVVYNYADNVRFSLERSSIDLSTGTDYNETQLTAIYAF